MCACIYYTMSYMHIIIIHVLQTEKERSMYSIFTTSYCNIFRYFFSHMYNIPCNSCLSLHKHSHTHTHWALTLPTLHYTIEYCTTSHQPSCSHICTYYKRHFYIYKVFLYPAHILTIGQRLLLKTIRNQQPELCLSSLTAAATHTHIHTYTH